jgi:hypothetical protein
VAKVSRHVAKIVLNGVSFEWKKEKSPSKAWAFSNERIDIQFIISTRLKPTVVIG